jgi:hypothetical protein
VSLELFGCFPQCGTQLHLFAVQDRNCSRLRVHNELGTQRPQCSEHSESESATTTVVCWAISSPARQPSQHKLQSSKHIHNSHASNTAATNKTTSMAPLGSHPELNIGALRDCQAEPTNKDKSHGPVLLLFQGTAQLQASFQSCSKPLGPVAGSAARLCSMGSRIAVSPAMVLRFTLLYAQVPTHTVKLTTTGRYFAIAGNAGSSTSSTCHALHKHASSTSPVKPAADRGALSSRTLLWHSCPMPKRPIHVCLLVGEARGFCQMGLCMGPGARSLVRPPWRPAPPKTVSLNTTTTTEGERCVCCSIGWQ